MPKMYTVLVGVEVEATSPDQARDYALEELRDQDTFGPLDEHIFIKEGGQLDAAKGESFAVQHRTRINQPRGRN